MKRAIFLFILFLPRFFAQSQSNNDLLPSEFLVENLSPVYHSFYTDSPWEGRYFSMKDSFNALLPNIFLKLANNPNNRVYGLSESNFYPYDIENQKKLDQDEIFMAFGGQNRVLATNSGETHLMKTIDTSEIEALEFIETWKLDTANDDFIKTVKGFIPIRKYSTSDENSPMFSRTCIIMQHTLDHETKERKLIARVKYEVPLIDGDEDLATCLSNNGTNPNELLLRLEMLNNPMLTSYSRYMLISYLENIAIQDRKPCYDFKTNELINDQDIINKAFGYNNKRISMISMDGLVTDTLIQEKTGYLSSIVFCEEWYIDPETGYFSKEVTGMAPVLWDENNQKSIDIVLWFDKTSMF